MTDNKQQRVLGWNLSLRETSLSRINRFYGHLSTIVGAQVAIEAIYPTKTPLK